MESSQTELPSLLHVEDPLVIATFTFKNARDKDTAVTYL
jgi:hypothetical protein